MARFKIRNGVRRQHTAEEEIAEDKRQAEQAIMRQAEKVIEDARQSNIDSTKSKLQALGLTVDEIKDTFNI